MSLSIPLAEAELEMVRKIKVEKYFLLPILLLSQFFVCLDSFFVSIFFFLFFSCPEQLNRWPCHSLTNSVTDWLTFTFDIQRAILETCDHWDIWSEWWGDMTWLRNPYKIWKFSENLKIVRSCLLITLIKCLNGGKSLGFLFVCQK